MIYDFRVSMRRIRTVFVLNQWILQRSNKQSLIHRHLSIYPIEQRLYCNTAKAASFMCECLSIGN